jgi:hypothetical protein
MVKYPFRIVVIKNRITFNIDDDLQKLREYEEARTPFQFYFHTVESDLSIRHSSFGKFRRPDNSFQELFGLDGIKEQIRQADLVPRHLFQVCVFLYNYHDNPREGIVPWSLQNELYEGTEFIEIPITKEWDRAGETFRELTHELCHAYVKRARRKGFAVEDHMDSTPVLIPNGTVEWRPYYNEFDVHARDGNRAVQHRLLEPYWEAIASQPKLALLAQQIMSYVPKKEPSHPAGRIQWAKSIKKHEGWYPGSRSYRNNSPGNMRFAEWMRKDLKAIGGDKDNYAVFKTIDDGWNGLLKFLQFSQEDLLRPYKGNPTLYEFFAGRWINGQWVSGYAPAADSNTPRKYAQDVANDTGHTIDTRIKSII